jgi:tetratricopeptide (TPR) repeat protein
MRQQWILTLGIWFALAAPAGAGTEEDLAALQQRWATARYETPAAEQKPQLTQLVKDADALIATAPGNPAVWLWSAVIRGSLAETTGNLSALGLAKEAKVHLEKALALDPTIEAGYAHGVLGQMYAKVPGWPVGYGDKKKAKEHLQKALAISPNGIDSNYFYAQFLFEQGEYELARQHALRSQTAPPRVQGLADRGRRRDIQELLDKINKKLP